MQRKCKLSRCPENLEAALIISSISGVLLHRTLQIFVLETLSPDKMPTTPRSPPLLFHKREKKRRGPNMTCKVTEKKTGKTVAFSSISQYEMDMEN